MAVNNTRLNVTEFDFDEVKNNLKIFLKGQTDFTDYDFEGSGMSALLDVLAYNTHYLGFNANMLANEMFLDSSSIRSSVVSHAKTLGYVPISSRCPVATVDISLNTSSLANATMPAGTIFNSSVDGTSYQFVTATDRTSSNIGATIPYRNTKIYEGTFVSTRYTVDTSAADQRFIITDNRADTSTLTVKVQTSSGNTTVTSFTEATDITQLTSTSNVYFLQEVESAKFEVYFGDGIIGTALSDDNIVILTYVVGNREAANGASIFTNSASIAGVNDVAVATVDVANGGGNPESIQSIKYNAPLDYAAQGRCVTAEDFKVYTKQLYPNAQSIQVFGGESGSFDSSLGVVSTPEYGKVFIAIKTTTGLALTATEKSQLVADFGRYKVMSITPVIVDAETVFLILNTTFKYDSSVTTLAVDELETVVTNSLASYNDSNLEQFDGLFRYSKVLGIIDSSDTSILSNSTNITMAKFFTPILTASTAYYVYFNNALYYPHSGHNAASGGVVASTGFYISGDATNLRYFDDDGIGNLRTYYLSTGVRVYDSAAAGTVAYATGTISITGIHITSVANVDGAASASIRITVIPDSRDIVSVRNQTLEIDFVNSTIKGESDSIAISNSGAGSSYTTTSAYTPTSGY